MVGKQYVNEAGLGHKPINKRNRFIVEPLVRILHHSDGWQLATIARYTFGSAVIAIPIGFETDFASVPWYVRGLIKVNGKHRLAALLHDWIYSCEGDIGFNRLTRKECDILFLEEMKNANVKYIKRYAMYWGVRIGGSKHFYKRAGNEK